MITNQNLANDNNSIAKQISFAWSYKYKKSSTIYKYVKPCSSLRRRIKIVFIYRDLQIRRLPNTQKIWCSSQALQLVAQKHTEKTTACKIKMKMEDFW